MNEHGLRQKITTSGEVPIEQFDWSTWYNFDIINRDLVSNQICLCKIIFVLDYPSNSKQILHPLLLNTKIYYTQGGNISQGRRPSEIFATEGVINLVFNSRGCNIRFIMHLHRISGEKKIMM